mmetsp:Transcript_2136/g.2739  ORF Transcript_2136/g.2739 Transcript_2136/m.2739 type:complete len:294 (-) Transcript_2136:18-899(-)
MKEKNQEDMKRGVVRAVLEAVYILAHYLEPYSPQGAAGIFEKIGVEKTKICALSPNFDNLPPGTKTYVGDVLYQAVEYQAGNDVKQADDKSKTKTEKGGISKASKQPKSKPQKKGQQAQVSDDGGLFYKMDIRVGKIVKVWHHETAEKLYCECIDVGEDKPREIASGLRQFYDLEGMQGRLVLAICNLKPANLVGFKSHGMVLCAANDAHDRVEFVEPPADSKIGERVFLEGDDQSALPPPGAPNAVTKKKIFKNVAVDLKTNKNCEGTWQGKRLVTSKGVCKAKTLVDVHLS